MNVLSKKITFRHSLSALLTILLFIIGHPAYGQQREVLDDGSVTYTIYKTLLLRKSTMEAQESGIYHTGGASDAVRVDIYSDNHFEHLNLMKTKAPCKDNLDCAKIFKYSKESPDFKTVDNNITYWLGGPTDYNADDDAAAQGVSMRRYLAAQLMVNTRGWEGRPNWDIPAVGVPVRIVVTFSPNSDIADLDSIRVPFLRYPLLKANLSESKYIKSAGMRLLGMEQMVQHMDYTRIIKSGRVKDYMRFSKTLLQPIGWASNYANTDEVRRIVNGDILVPFAAFNDGSKARVTSNQPFFKIQLAPQESFYVFAHNLATLSGQISNLTAELSGETTNIVPEITVVSKNGEDAAGPVFHCAYVNDEGSISGTRGYYLFKVKWPGTTPVSLKLTVVSNGPFPVAPHIEIGPKPIPHSEAFRNGPTLTKRNLIGAHRGLYSEPGIPENSPWSWEKVFYENKNGGNYIDFIEIDVSGQSRDEVIFLAHDPFPYREIALKRDDADARVLGLWSYLEDITKRNGEKKLYRINSARFNYNATTQRQSYVDVPEKDGAPRWTLTKDETEPEGKETHTYSALGTSKLTDLFGKEVPYTHPLTIDEAFKYFNCRQRKNACDCLKAVNYLPVDCACDAAFFEQDDWKNKSWVLENDSPDTIMIALDKVISKEAKHFVEIFRMSLDNDMEDYLVIGGSSPPKAFYSSLGDSHPPAANILTSGTLLIDRLELAHDMKQVLYNPVFYPDFTGKKVTPSQDFSTFIRGNSYGNSHRRIHIIGCQPQLNMPSAILSSSENTKRRKSALAGVNTIINNAAANNLWIEIYGGTPISPFGMGSRPSTDFATTLTDETRQCSSFDWRSTPEFAWNRKCNLWVSDSPDLINKFLLKAENSSALRSLSTDLYSSSMIVEGNSYLAGRSTANYNEYFFTSTHFETDNDVGYFNPANQLIATRSIHLMSPPSNNYETATCASSGTNVGALKMHGDGTNNALRMDNFFGLTTDERKHFAVSMWVYYDKDRPTFNIFSAYTEAISAGTPNPPLVFALKAVDGKLVWTRNTGNVSTVVTDQYKPYDYTMDKNLVFDDANSGWYFVGITMTPYACRVMLGKPSDMTYQTNEYGTDYGYGKRQPYVEDNPKVAVAYYWMGSFLQGFDRVGASYIGDPTTGHENSPNKIGKLRIYDKMLKSDQVYSVYNLMKCGYSE